MTRRIEHLTNAVDGLPEQSRSETAARSYRAPEVHEMGSLDVVQNGRYGDNYDYNPPWLCYCC